MAIYDKKYNCQIVKKEDSIIKRQKNGLLCTKISDNCSDFFTKFWDRISQKNIRGFYFDESTIKMTVVKFENEDLLQTDVSIDFDQKLLEDSDFMALLNSFLSDYKMTLEEMETKTQKLLEEYYKQDAFMKKATNMLQTYCDTGMITGTEDTESLSELVEFIKENKNRLICGDFMEQLKPFQKHKWIKHLFDVVGIIVMMLLFVLCAISMPVALTILSNLGIWGIFATTIPSFSATSWFIFKASDLTDSYDKKVGSLKEGYIDELVEELETRYIQKSNTSALNVGHVEDPFFNYIKADILYMSTHPEVDFRQLCIDFNGLIQDYVDAKVGEVRGGLPVDRYKYLSRLTDLEISMYGKNTALGLKKEDITCIQASVLKDRLEYLRDDREVTLDNPYLGDIYDTIKDIIDTPYEGCERDVLKLFRIAQDYVMDSVHPKVGLELNSAESVLVKKQVAIELDAERNHHRAIKYESLQKDLAVLKRLMGEIAMTLEDEKSAIESEKKSYGMQLGSH